MGFLETLFGRTPVPKAREDQIFAITTAWLTLQTAAGLEPCHRAGIVFRDLPAGRFDQLTADVKQLIGLESGDTGMQLQEHRDQFGFDWLILSGADVPDLTTALHGIAQSLMEQGLGDLHIAGRHMAPLARSRAISPAS